MFTIEGHQIGRGTKYQHSALLRKRNSAITNKKAKRCIFSEILIAIIVTFPNCNFFSRFYSILCAQSHLPGQHYVKCNGYHNVAYLLHAEQIFEQLFFHLLLWVYKVGKQSLLILWTMNLDCIKCFSMLKYV